MGMREKLLGYLHRVFDKDPHKVLAFRIRHNRGLNWSVSDRVLTIESLGSKRHYDLTGMTITDLYRKLLADGYSVPMINSDIMHLQADVLLNGKGNQDTSNGDHIYAYSSTLYAVLDAYAFIMEVTYQNAVLNAIDEAYLDKADGYWLDKWLRFFNAYRRQDETDRSFLERAIRDVTRNRTNASAIELTIAEETGLTVRIHELWKDIFILDSSLLSGGHAFQDGEFYTWGTIEAICYENLTDEQQAAVDRIINRDSLIGVLYWGVNRSDNIVISRDINFHQILDFTTEKATWKNKKRWIGKWSDLISFGFTVSMGLS